MNDKEFKIFIDFDGTITKKDTGEAIFERFGDEDEVKRIIDDLLNDRISARQCWMSLCNSTRIESVEELDKFIDTIEIDPAFHNFVSYCRDNEISFYVLSDGFGYYIDRIFTKENLRDINYYANELEITEDNKLIPRFPYLDINCETSANCKRNHIINHSGDEEYTVYIGDGNSDKYTAQFCDFIFAKDDLLKFCEKERISFFPYKDFNDVVERLESLRNRKRLKKRHQAELKRKQVYISE